MRDIFEMMIIFALIVGIVSLGWIAFWSIVITPVNVALFVAGVILFPLAAWGFWKRNIKHFLIPLVLLIVFDFLLIQKYWVIAVGLNHGDTLRTDYIWLGILAGQIVGALLFDGWIAGILWFAVSTGRWLRTWFSGGSQIS